ncbi:MAG: hypothetical protein K2X93_12655 [Candidatus Obscuribacterales bacterium]|nr:hypothetical protein [Candidatus Obscuribacterales bacterium]
MVNPIEKQFTDALSISFTLLILGLNVLPSRAESNGDTMFTYLNGFAEAIYLYESGQFKLAITKLDKLSAQVDKAGAKRSTQTNLPLLRSNTKCGDSLKQLSAELLELKGLAQLGLDQRTPALASLRKSATICPEHSAIHGSLGSALLRIRRIKDGLTQLNRAITLDASNREALSARGQALGLLGRSREAQFDVSRANKLTKEQNKKIDSLTANIDTLFRENKINETLKLDEQLLRLAPRDSLVLAGYAEHLMASSRSNEAMRYIACATSLDPTNAYAVRVRSWINGQLHKPELELRDAKRALSIEPRSLEALKSRALAFLDNDQPVQALNDYNLVLKRKSDFVDGYINRSTIYLRLGDTARSIKDAKMAVSLAPTSPYGYQSLGAAFRRAGMLDEARHTLELSLRYSDQANPDSLAMSHFNLGAVLTGINKKSDAQIHLDEALMLAPELPRILLMRGAYDASPPVVDETSRLLNRPASRMNTPKLSKLRRPTQKAAIGKSIASPKTLLKTPTRTIRQSIPDLEDALLAANTAIAAVANDASLYNVRATVYLCKGQFAEAAGDFRKTAEILGWSGEVAQRALINYYLCQERLQKAAEAKSIVQAHRVPFQDNKNLPSASAANSRPTASSLNHLLLSYLFNEITEDALTKHQTNKSNLTTIHYVCAMHSSNLGMTEKSKQHWQLILDNSATPSTELVIAAAEHVGVLPRRKLAK